METVCLKISFPKSSRIGSLADGFCCRSLNRSDSLLNQNFLKFVIALRAVQKAAPGEDRIFKRLKQGLGPLLRLSGMTPEKVGKQSRLNLTRPRQNRRYQTWKQPRT